MPIHSFRRLEFTKRENIPELTSSLRVLQSRFFFHNQIIA